MKNKLLMLSFIFFTTAKIGAAEHGDVLVHPSPPPLRNSHDFSNGETHESSKLKINTTDPYELDERHVDLFNEGKFEESSRALIASAIHGHEDNRSYLCAIDSQSLEYLTSHNPQSTEALSYYDTILLPKVIDRAKFESAQLKEAEKKPLILSWTK